MKLHVSFRIFRVRIGGWAEPQLLELAVKNAHLPINPLRNLIGPQNFNRALSLGVCIVSRQHLFPKIDISEKKWKKSKEPSRLQSSAKANLTSFLRVLEVIFLGFVKPSEQ